MISVTRIFRLSMRVAHWAEPHVKEWHRQRHLNRVEGQRHLDARNWSEVLLRIDDLIEARSDRVVDLIWSYGNEHALHVRLEK